MLSIRGRFEKGFIRPDQFVQGREGQTVIITFVEEVESRGVEQNTDDWAVLMRLVQQNAVETGIVDLAHQHDQEVMARIQATPPNPAAVVLPTQTIEEVEAIWQANSSGEADISPEQWDRLWAGFEQELKTNDRADDIAEGRS